MARNHFDLERSRRINISIPGYDPAMEAKKAAGRMQRKWSAEKQKSSESSAAKPAPIATKEDETTQEDVDALNVGLLATHPTDRGMTAVEESFE